MRFLMGMLAALSLARCGINEVTISVEGGDGNKVRLDLDALQLKNNRLVDAGSTSFTEVKDGSYVVNVVANNYMATETLVVESAPMSGVKKYDLTFVIPPGANQPFRPQGTILFAATPTKIRDWNLYTIEASGGEPTQLTHTREFEQQPAWSPDGTEIAYSLGEVMTNIDVYVMAADGTGAQRLTEHAERDGTPAWSPDGSKIAFVSQREGDVAVWIMDRDGGNKRKLVKGREPSWSPDGKRLAFTSGHFDGVDEIYIIDADGSNRRRLTESPRYFDWFASWSPDGKRLAFNSERFGGQELMVADVESGAQVRITMAEHTFEQKPVWSPDGRGLAYQGKMNFREDGTLDVHFSSKTGKHRPEGTFDIFVVPAVGFDWDDIEDHSMLPVNLTNTPDYIERWPSWRPPTLSTE